MSDWAITYSKDEATERQVLPFPHKPSPEEVAEHLLEWAEANLKPGHYSTGKLESDEPAELLLRRFGIVVTGIAEACSLPRPADAGRFRR
ncbi:hypothetical protein I5J18_28085 [Pseudomonas aeruginosa]|nr:hypothetical protein [Pseudomonas aeruginosa]MBG7165117.1 hypothetical protein [Pseudomonas aeruginosa]